MAASSTAASQQVIRTGAGARFAVEHPYYAATLAIDAAPRAALAADFA